MKRITIQELHEDTDRWVNEAATNGDVIITRDGTSVATLSQFGPAKKETWMRDRLAKISELPFIPIDSAAYISEDRDRT